MHEACILFCCMPVKIAEAENYITNEVTVDIMPAVNYPVTSSSKETKETQLKAVNCQSVNRFFITCNELLSSKMQCDIISYFHLF